MILLEIIYALVVILLAIYGFNTLILTWMRARLAGTRPAAPQFDQKNLPPVTVQLPVYNEKYVVQRLIEAAVNLDYPPNRLEIQVLDDSDDSTKEIIARSVALYQNQGIDIKHIRRSKRSGFKSGALAFGMEIAKGDYFAIFDADFLPSRDFLKASLPHLLGDPSIGCVQARWGHLNRDSSWLTRAQATGIDGHFQVEQAARSGMDLFLNFNGTAGIWRRGCINEAGGWQSDTLTEDLDLSYRAQLKGWRILYLPQVSVPAELPVHINAFKRQQFRWAKGSIQSARKLLPLLWRSGQPFRIKLAGSIHLTHYLVHPLILINLLLTLPVLYMNSRFFWTVHIFTTAAVGPLLMYWLSMRKDGQTIGESLKHLVFLLLLGMGLSVNNTRAVLEATLGIKTSFLRTPKFDIKGNRSLTKGPEYQLPRDLNVWIELFFALFGLTLLAFVLFNGSFGLVIWLLLYTGGFVYITYLGITQTALARLKVPADHIPAPKSEKSESSSLETA
jgi:cellulose synthase/poly-beta-1,6-N-acetylglucosamine synthase-like glycosyltransferase